MSGKTVVIAGGGISGLSAAYHLAKSGAPMRIILLEKEQRLGGTIVTMRENGFLIEGGPDCFISEKPQALRLCEELGIGSEVIGTNDAMRRTFVLWKGQLRGMPEGVVLMIPTRFMPFLMSDLFSLRGKLRMGMDLFIGPRSDGADESLAGFVTRRLGSEALKRLAQPLVAGVHAGDPETMSVRSSFPRFVEMERKHGSLIKAMLAARREARRRRRKGEPERSIFLTMRQGLGFLVETLAGRLAGCEARTGCEVAEARRGGDGKFTLKLGSGAEIAADAIILATPAFVSARLIENLDAELAERLASIPYVSTATVSLGFRREGFAHPLDGFGFVVPAAEGRRIMAATWSSTKFAGRCPEDSALVRFFVGGANAENLALLPEEELVGLAGEEMARTMGVSASPCLAKVFRWEKAMPQYTIGHEKKLTFINERLSSLPGVFLAGGAFRGIGISDCIREGAEAADTVAKFLGSGA